MMRRKLHSSSHDSRILFSSLVDVMVEDTLYGLLATLFSVISGTFVKLKLKTLVVVVAFSLQGILEDVRPFIAHLRFFLVCCQISPQ